MSAWPRSSACRPGAQSSTGSRNAVCHRARSAKWKPPSTKSREGQRAQRSAHEYKRKHRKPNAAMSWMMQRSNYVYACLQGNRVLTRSYEHLVGAYGVVGLSGVKDARKSVVAADALRRLAHRRLGHHARANTGQTVDRNWTETGQTLDKGCAETSKR